MLQEGDKAPDFSLESDSGARVSLRDFADKTLVLYFYPKDSTPGCTRQAQGFSAASRAIELAGAAVVGVSKDSVKSHCSFRDKFALTIPLLSDPDLTVHRAYGAYGTKKMYGRDVEGTLRTTFLVKDGHIARVFSNVKVDGHADAVLQAIGELTHGPSSRRIPTMPPPKKVKKAVTKTVKKIAAAAKRVVKKIVAKRKTTKKKSPKSAKRKNASRRR